MDLKEFSTEDLEKKYKTTAVLTYMLAGMLIVLLGLGTYLSLKNGFNAIVVVPIALSAVVMTNFKTIKLMKAELADRKAGPENQAKF